MQNFIGSQEPRQEQRAKIKDYEARTSNQEPRAKNQEPRTKSQEPRAAGTAYLGRRIRLEFTTNDCTFNAHFGYVYLDVTENCSYPVTGNVTCPGTEPIVLKALAGFNEYEWTDTKTGELLGKADSLILPADTPVGRQLSVKLKGQHH